MSSAAECRSGLFGYSRVRLFLHVVQYCNVIQTQLEAVAKAVLSCLSIVQVESHAVVHNKSDDTAMVVCCYAHATTVGVRLAQSVVCGGDNTKVSIRIGTFDFAFYLDTTKN